MGSVILFLTQKKTKNSKWTLKPFPINFRFPWINLNADFYLNPRKNSVCSPINWTISFEKTVQDFKKIQLKNSISKLSECNTSLSYVQHPPSNQQTSHKLSWFPIWFHFTWFTLGQHHHTTRPSNKIQYPFGVDGIMYGVEEWKPAN